MRPKCYMRATDGRAKRMEFEDVHFAEAGVSFSPEAGMPLLEALLLMNKWNAAASVYARGTYSFWIPEE